jgi:hypothetical protein
MSEEQCVAFVCDDISSSVGLLSVLIVPFQRIKVLFRHIKGYHKEFWQDSEKQHKYMLKQKLYCF